MDSYQMKTIQELNKWKKKMQKKPSLINKASKGVQGKFNDMLPEKYHQIMTVTIKNMIKGVLIGSQITTKKLYPLMSLEAREDLVREKIKVYKTASVIEGIGTGAGGFLMAMADFPLLISIKIKLLYDIASIYGFDIRDYRERLYILNIFQLAFSSQAGVNDVFAKMSDWDKDSKALPADLNLLDWRTLQQEYKDYIDLAKLLQIIPGVGAVVGGYANAKLLDKLGETAMNAYRMRVLGDGPLVQ